MLSEHEEWHLEQLLNGLGENRTKLKTGEQKFVDDTTERYDKFGANIFLSSKQLSWLEDLYSKHVAPL
jgi:ribosome assembly protein YihI (activator of Der GTPase)